MDKSLLSNNQFYHNGFISTSRREFITNTAKLPIETVKKLIAAVGKRPDLWDRNYDRFGKKRSQSLWRDISAEVNLPVDICRIKWGHLRDNFRKVFIRNTLTDETPTSWRFYNDMRFMEKTISRNIAYKNRLQKQRAQKRAQNALPPPRQNDDTFREFAQAENSIRRNRGHNFHEDSQPILENAALNDDHYIDDSSACKGIKIESPDSEADRQLQAYNYIDGNNTPAVIPATSATNDISSLHQNSQNVDYINTDDTPLEECYRDHLSYHQTLTKAKSQIYTIELFDDEQPRELLPAESQRSNKNDDYAKRSSLKSSYPGANCAMDNINRCGDEEDTDRLFLLSLLPYLQSIPMQRKLHVRQKLQRVLIEESA